MIVMVDNNICDQCGTCISVCKTNSILLKDKLHINNTTCSSCGLCVTVCPFGALSMDSEKRDKMDKSLSEQEI